MAQSNRMLYYKEVRCLVVLLFLFCSVFLAAQVTYFDHIAPIMQVHCQGCHKPGDIGPMPLTTYEEVSSYASMIKYVTDAKLMPPFKANASKILYANERSISDEERRLIAQWISDGLPMGRPKAASHKTKPDQHSDYDYTVCMEESFEHYGIYYDQYQVYPLTLNLPEGKYVTDVVFSPGNREVVRSANISIAPSGASQKQDQWDPRYGFFAYSSLGFTSSFPNWFSWMPHTKATGLSEGELLYLSPDSELLMHIHYGPYGEITQDSSCISFSFAERPGPILQNVPLVHEALLIDTFLIIGGLQNRVTTAFDLPIDLRLKSITPLAHLLCRSWQVFAVLPDSTSVSLLSIDDWDFHWREKYVFESPLQLPKGSKIYSTAIYDNTVRNPYNPSDPPQTMKAGPNMYDEKFECYFEIANKNSFDGYIVKPFVSTEAVLSEVSFYINKSDSIRLVLHDIDLQKEVVLSTKFYDEGAHRIRRANLPTSKGRYCISLESGQAIIDSWWFVLL